MSYIIINKATKILYGMDVEGNKKFGEEVLPYPGDNLPHTYETLQDCMDYLIYEIENYGRQISDFAIAEVKEMDYTQFRDMMMGYMEGRDES